MRTIRLLRFTSVALCLFLGLLLAQVSGYSQSPGVRSFSVDAATRSPLFRPMVPRNSCKELHSQQSSPSPRLPYLVSTALAAATFACANPPLVAQATTQPMVAATLAKRPKALVVEDEHSTLTNRGKGAGIVVVAVGAGTLIGRALLPDGREPARLDHGDEEEEDGHSADPVSVDVLSVDTEQQTPTYSYQEAAEQAVDRVLDRVTDETETPKATSTKTDAEVHRDRTHNDYLDHLSMRTQPEFSRDTEKTNALIVTETNEAEHAPPVTIQSTPSVATSLRKKSPGLLQQTVQKSASLARRIVPGFSSPFIAQTLDDPELCEKYAAIENVEDRAFEILLDLGLIDRTPNPDNPSYKYARVDVDDSQG